MAVQGDVATLKVVFRTDASLQIGTGHVMRCLTLADGLHFAGANCQFICREHEGHLIGYIQTKGYPVHVLPNPKTEVLSSSRNDNPYALWLGCSQEEDVQACKPILESIKPDWLIVDHYALDSIWEGALSNICRKLMVIDDLADRTHQCDVLLDQTYGRTILDYHSLVPHDCDLLCGSKYALLRPEFLELRPYSLNRRIVPAINELLITMGGVDRENVTDQVLKSLIGCPLPASCRVTVILGDKAPWLSEVKSIAAKMPWETRVLVGVNDMAQLMAESDLAIGAGGATSWERCCLGLPTILMVLAENQKYVATTLVHAGAVILVDGKSMHVDHAIMKIIQQPTLLKEISKRAAQLVDGNGVNRIVRQIGLAA